MKRSFSDRLSDFMRGHYGFDDFSKALFLIGFIIFIIGIFFDSHIISRVIYGIALIVYIYNLYRSTSKNFTQRQKENSKYLQIWSLVKKFFRSRSERFKNIRKYRYFHCPYCKTDLRVPRGKGTITLTCPKCQKQFDKHS